LATTIIESGIDIPTVNTLIVEEAEEIGSTAEIGLEIEQMAFEVGPERRQRACIHAWFTVCCPCLQIDQQAAIGITGEDEVAAGDPLFQRIEEAACLASIRAGMFRDDMAVALDQTIALPGRLGLCEKSAEIMIFENLSGIMPAQPGHGEVARPALRRGGNCGFRRPQQSADQVAHMFLPR